jgi:NADH-quinone oxidoreductase subunit G
MPGERIERGRELDGASQRQEPECQGYDCPERPGEEERPEPAPEETTGARLAWVPRRAGDRGAVEAGCLPNLLPGGRPVSDAGSRVDMGAVWGTEQLPDGVGRDAAGIVAAVASGELGGLVVGGVSPDDTADPAATRAAVEAAGFVVSLELRANEVTRAADVVFPVAPVVEKSGTFLTWEGRPRPFDKVLRDSHALPDLRVLAGVAEELGHDLGFRTVEQARAELAEVGGWDGARAATPAVSAVAPTTEPGTLRLATWKQMVDDGVMLDGDDYLKATGRAATALVSASTLAALGVVEGAMVTLAGERGSVALPVRVADVADDVVWAPSNTGGVNVNRDLGVPGSAVRVAGGAA